MTAAQEWAARWQEHLLVLAATDLVAVAVLQLHTPTDTYPSGISRCRTECDGCDGDGGYDREDPEWPCRTVATVAVVLGAPMTRPCPAHPGDADPPRVWPDGTFLGHCCQTVRTVSPTVSSSYPVWCSWSGRRAPAEVTSEPAR